MNVIPRESANGFKCQKGSRHSIFENIIIFNFQRVHRVLHEHLIIKQIHRK